MTRLRFKEPIRFQIKSVVMFEFAWNLRGKFLSGKLNKGRTLRVAPDEHWFETDVIEIPGIELNEIRAWVGIESYRRGGRRPIYGDELFVFPLASQRFAFTEVLVIRKNKLPEKTKRNAEIREQIAPCVRCGARMKRRYSYGRSVFFGCSQYPKCNYSHNVPPTRVSDVED